MLSSTKGIIGVMLPQDRKCESLLTLMPIV